MLFHSQNSVCVIPNIDCILKSVCVNKVSSQNKEEVKEEGIYRLSNPSRPPYSSFDAILKQSPNGVLCKNPCCYVNQFIPVHSTSVLWENSRTLLDSISPFPRRRRSLINPIKAKKLEERRKSGLARRLVKTSFGNVTFAIKAYNF